MTRVLYSFTEYLLCAPSDTRFTNHSQIRHGLCPQVAHSLVENEKSLESIMQNFLQDANTTCPNSEDPDDESESSTQKSSFLLVVVYLLGSP